MKSTKETNIKKMTCQVALFERFEDPSQRKNNQINIAQINLKNDLDKTLKQNKNLD
jgi:hypothetical protein